MKKVLIASSLFYDVIMDYSGSFADHIIPEKMKTLSVAFPVENLSRNFGGNGGNIGYTLSLLGTTSAILTSVGKNDFGPYESHLKKHGIDTSLVNQVKDELTAQCFIMSDKLHCQITGVFFGPMREDKDLSLLQIPHLDDYDFTIISTSTAESITKFSKEAQEKQIPYLYAPGQEITRLTSEQILIGIQGSTILVLNDYELALVMKMTNLTKNEILAKTEILITTLGKEGSVIETKHVEPIKVGTAKIESPRDPTGAGDSYIAGFTAGYIQKLPLKTCGQMGALTAAYTVEQFGTQNHTFTREEFKERYQVAFGEELAL